MGRSWTLAKASTAALALSASLAPLSAQGAPVNAWDRAEPLIAHEHTKLIPSELAPFDHFGGNVAISGESMLIGAKGVDQPGATDVGAAYVFVRDGTGWALQAELTAPDAALDDSFGHAVAISGDTAIVGAHRDDHGGGPAAGSAYVFVRNGTIWTQQAKLTASDATAFDRFGSAVALSGDRAIVGAYNDDIDGAIDAGSAYIFVRGEDIWRQEDKLTASDADTIDIFGAAVALAGDTAIVGAPWDSHAGGSEPGSAYVFVRNGSRWSEQAKLVAPEAGDGDLFGLPVAISGGTILVGSGGDSHAAGVQAGSAHVFVLHGAAWSAQATLTASDAEAGDRFGSGVALLGGTAVIGSSGDVHSGDLARGSAYVFETDGSLWTERFKLAASDATTVSGGFGLSIGISGDTVVCGAFDDDAGGLHAGAAYTFALLDDPWISLGYGTAGVAGTPALSGRGDLTPGSGGVLVLSGAAPAAPALLFASLNATPSPFECGTLVPAVGDLESLQVTEANGTVLIPWAHWLDGLAGLDLFLQIAVLDAEADCGVALSNALAADVP